jgi:hypothetical protein
MTGHKTLKLLLLQSQIFRAHRHLGIVKIAPPRVRQLADGVFVSLMRQVKEDVMAFTILYGPQFPREGIFHIGHAHCHCLPPTHENRSGLRLNSKHVSQSAQNCPIMISQYVCMVAQRLVAVIKGTQEIHYGFVGCPAVPIFVYVA